MKAGTRHSCPCQDVRMNDVPVRTWCQEQGTDWQSIFCERVMHCVLRADQRCRQEVCLGAPVADQTSCQTRCLEYAKSSPRAVAVSFTQSMETECEEFQDSQQSASDFNATSLLDSMGSGIPSECTDLALQQLQIFNRMAEQQSSRSQDQCDFATLAVNNVDFIAGISMGLHSHSKHAHVHVHFIWAVHIPIALSMFEEVCVSAMAVLQTDQPTPFQPAT